MNLVRGGAAAVLAVAMLAACTPAATDAGPPSSTSATYPLDPRPVRPDEIPLRLPPVVEGDTSFTLIGLTKGISSLVGSHAEWNAKGQYYRIRLVITNVGRSSVPFDTARQLLVLSNGSTVAPDPQAMLIKRQPGQFDLGAAVRVEFDLYYDIAKDATPTALRVFGGPTLTDGNDEQGTDIPLS
ncbi:MAG TPA: hypothetical protein VGX25_12215 [Actinophytocola sp.]|uniref:hypothetical protein n=1 Tax=Actinophytocola sp. TaxID=1872138 RepID=UPI002DDCDC21|nr:hypothetical protein [Actinophytocola sp.]HEV2780148.1 hypothetical protein [Actinophytocola sp.]